MRVSEKMIDLILCAEDNASRFEVFCCELLSETEGITYVPTSKTWDRGRDGRSVGSRPRARSILLCASLSTDITAKVRADIEKLRESAPDAIVYCTTAKLSERGGDAIRGEVSRILPSVANTEVLGLLQLRALADRKLEVFQRHYNGEWNELRDALQTGGSGPDDLRGLKIALVTQLQPDADELREQVSRNLIIEILSEGPLGRDEIVSRASCLLHTGKPLGGSSLQHILDEMRREGTILLLDGRFCIAENSDLLRDYEENVAARILKGRNALRKYLKEQTGAPIDPPNFERIWPIVRQGIVELFLSHGIDVAEAVLVAANHPETAPEARETRNMADQIQAIAQDVEGAFPGREMGVTLGQAVQDMFYERSGDIHAWLSQLCAAYVCLCSCGFEPGAAEAITERLGELKLVLDTHVLIALLV